MATIFHLNCHFSFSADPGAAVHPKTLRNPQKPPPVLFAEKATG
jgi:hypothetical protein